MTSFPAGLKYRKFANRQPPRLRFGPNMSSRPESSDRKTLPLIKPMEKLCRHTRVRVVAREEDVEFVECQECGDVFDSREFRDMAIEENIEPEQA